MSPSRPRLIRLGAVAAALSLTLVATGCGDDDDTTTADEETSETTEAAAADTQEYCDLVEEMDGQDGPPTEAQLEKIKEVRPDEIGEETDRVADALLTADGDYGTVFSDPAVQEDIGVLEEHDARVCGFEPSDDEGDDGDEPDTEPAEGAQVVPVTAVDYAFEGLPAQVPAGPVAFAFTNEGEEAHELALFKVGEGVDLDALLASEREPTEEEVMNVGRTFTEPGGAATYANTELEPGTYAAICFIPSPEGKAHYELGMKTTFEVG